LTVLFLSARGGCAITLEPTGLVTLLEDSIRKAVRSQTSFNEIIRQLPRVAKPRPLAELGHNFLKQRRIPEVYCRIARDHHLEPCDPADVLMAIVRLADLSVRKLGLGIHPDPSLVLATTAEAACLDVNEIMLAELEVMIEDNVLAVARGGCLGNL
jgi:hypothetical protein